MIQDETFWTGYLYSSKSVELFPLFVFIISTASQTTSDTQSQLHLIIIQRKHSDLCTFKMSFNYEDITGNISSLGTHTEQPQEKDKLFLPPEVWGLICSQLRVISMPSLLNLSLVSTTLYTEALAHLYYEITIPDRKDLDLSILYGVNSTYVRKYTKSLVISSSVRSSIMTQISKLIPECLVLESIRFVISLALFPLYSLLTHRRIKVIHPRHGNRQRSKQLGNGKL